MMKSILVLAAHPDDETLGAGGAIAKWASEGAKVHVAFFTDGVSSRGGDRDSLKKSIIERRAAAEKACGILKAIPVSFGDFPDNQMDTVPLLTIARSVEELVKKYQPDAVVTHHAGDLNMDHRLVHQAAVTACRPQKGHPVKTLLFFEIPSSTEWQTPGSGPIFAPNFFVDISATWERKRAALGAYQAEMRAWPHPRSVEGVEHLARWRGAVVGVDAAEGFILGRHLL